MKTVFKLLTSILFVLFLASCASITPNMLHSDRLKSGEGIVVARVYGLEGDSKAIFHQFAPGPPAFGLGIKNSDNLKVFKLSGKTRFKLTTFKTGSGLRAYFNHDKFYFDLKFGVINYIGDIHIKTNSGGVSVGVVNNSNETLEVAKKRYPQLFDLYPVEINLLGGE